MWFALFSVVVVYVCNIRGEGGFFLVFKNTLLKEGAILLLKNNNGGKIIEVKNGGSACKMPSNKNQELLLWGAKNKIK